MAEGRFRLPPSLDVAEGNVAENFKRWKRQMEVYLAASGSLEKRPFRCATEKEMADIIQSMKKDSLQTDSPIYDGYELSVQMVRSSVLEERYRLRKKLMREELDATGKRLNKLEETFCYTSVPNIDDVCTDGIKVNPNAPNTLGNNLMGIYLFRYPDACLLQKTRQSGKDGSDIQLLVCKVILGKKKLVRERDDNSKEIPLEPTPNYHCHISGQPAKCTDQVETVIRRSQVYLYEYDDACLPSQSPRQCLPVAVITAKRVSKQPKTNGSYEQTYNRLTSRNKSKSPKASSQNSSPVRFSKRGSKRENRVLEYIKVKPKSPQLRTTSVESVKHSLPQNKHTLDKSNTVDEPHLTISKSSDELQCASIEDTNVDQLPCLSQNTEPTKHTKLELGGYKETRTVKIYEKGVQSPSFNSSSTSKQRPGIDKPTRRANLEQGSSTASRFKNIFDCLTKEALPSSQKESCDVKDKNEQKLNTEIASPIDVNIDDGAKRCDDVKNKSDAKSLVDVMTGDSCSHTSVIAQSSAQSQAQITQAGKDSVYPVTNNEDTTNERGALCNAIALCPSDEPVKLINRSSSPVPRTTDHNIDTNDTCQPRMEPADEHHICESSKDNDKGVKQQSTGNVKEVLPIQEDDEQATTNIELKEPMNSEKADETSTFPTNTIESNMETHSTSREKHDKEKQTQMPKKLSYPFPPMWTYVSENRRNGTINPYTLKRIMNKVCKDYGKYIERYNEWKDASNVRDNVSSDPIQCEHYEKKVSSLALIVASTQIEIEAAMSHLELHNYKEQIGDDKSLSDWQKEYLGVITGCIKSLAEKVASSENCEEYDVLVDSIRKLKCAQKKIYDIDIVPKLPEDSPGNNVAILSRLLEHSATTTSLYHRHLVHKLTCL